MMRIIPVGLFALSLLVACAGREPAPPGTAGEVGPDDTRGESRIALLDSDRISREQEARVRRALAGQQRALAADETGYYLDVLEARLRQTLRHWELGLDRDGQAVLLTVPAVLAFNTGSATLLLGAEDLMAAIGDIVNEFESVLVTIHGHTDRLGPADLNLRLSEQRALAMGHFLLDAGVAGERLAAVGHGEALPITDAADTENLLRNRRMEFRLEPLIR